MSCRAGENRIIISEVMMPSQANVAGNVHGGEIMKMMDSAAYAAARRYARSNVVTARVDELEFHLPILIGDLVVCTADIVFVGHSSMEIAVNVEVEDLEHEGKPPAGAFRLLYDGCTRSQCQTKDGAGTGAGHGRSESSFWRGETSL